MDSQEILLQEFPRNLQHSCDTLLDIFMNFFESRNCETDAFFPHYQALFFTLITCIIYSIFMRNAPGFLWELLRGKYCQEFPEDFFRQFPGSSSKSSLEVPLVFPNPLQLFYRHSSRIFKRYFSHSSAGISRGSPIIFREA